ncbi:MAG: hypothetical protein ONB48_21345 [candidate division KSB1 bacterium]|nr:hypothetical protein [candidate division KSB1 bacterium]MDZ7274826.1 hypothetical protein [candidate division KSB1 bacterium]MDZ7288193.1 hypothetical protein [candidate division KSB1 bacterium]MDZ7300426.1 hypothetical protein [candidate division KSB1 bacterium]MDZ7308119.1 hypothetical protein [candidate division KSB1 bacterium]
MKQKPAQSLPSGFLRRPLDSSENAVAQASSLQADKMSALHFHRDGCPASGMDIPPKMPWHSIPARRQTENLRNVVSVPDGRTHDNDAPPQIPTTKIF